jgi:hypothetical protein
MIYDFLDTDSFDYCSPALGELCAKFQIFIDKDAAIAWLKSEQ